MRTTFYSACMPPVTVRHEVPPGIYIPTKGTKQTEWLTLEAVTMKK